MTSSADLEQNYDKFMPEKMSCKAVLTRVKHDVLFIQK